MSIKGPNRNFASIPAVEETMEESFGARPDHPAFGAVTNDMLKNALDTAIKRRALDDIIRR